MKTTKIILAGLLFTIALVGYSRPVDIEKARTVAQNFMSRTRGTSNTVSDVVIEQFEEQNSFYVINFREGGWVMVSAEDATIMSKIKCCILKTEGFVCL